MKNFIIALMLLIADKSIGQTCCSKDASWQVLASNADFLASHLAPEPFEYAADHGSMISFETLDATKGMAFYLPSDQATNQVLILFHEWWGLNDYIKQEAERYQKMLGNVDVYAVDLYDGKIAISPEQASELSKSLDAKRGEHIVQGLIRYIGKDKEIATLGWCMGGSWSFTATLLAEKQAKACVMYYGFPEQNEKKIATLQTDVLYIYASQDKFITKDKVDEFGKRVEGTGHKFILQSFNADHAFANPSNPKHDPVASENAQNITVNFLKEKLKLE